MSAKPKAHFHFAPAPTISMVEDTILIDLKSVLSDWDAYTFSLDVTSPGKKASFIKLLSSRLNIN